MQTRKRFIAALLVGAAASCWAAPTATSAAASSGAGDWPQMPHDVANTRFSPLAQITAANASELKLHASWFTGVKRGHEEGPIVVGDTMYLVGPWPNELVAFDLTKPSLTLKWRYEPHPKPFAQGVAGC